MSIVEENEDLFDRLPDSIILTIFDKLQDAKSLCISSSLSKRFHFLTTQTHHISLTIPPPKKSHNNTNPNKNQLTHFLNKLLFKPFLFVLKQINKWNPICMPVTYNTRKEDRCNNCFTCTCTCACTCSSPAEILRNFREIKEFEIRLASPPCDPLLKWKAEFGSQLKSCLIVGGTSFSPVRDNNNNNDHDEDALENSPISQQRGDLMEFQRMTIEDLKLRIVWIISSLLAASARYSLLEEIIKEKRTIKKVVITDDIGQGKCCMNEEQVEEMRRNMGVISSKMPALKVKMWYVPELEVVRERCVMKGATLVVVKPVEEWSKADDGGDLVAKGFGFVGEGKEGKVFDEVARELVKLERCYSLEMSSF
ncbi:F-box protein like [Capsicum chacoense]